MPDTKNSGLNAFTALASGDLLYAVDVSDTSMAPTGTSKHLDPSLLFGALTGDFTVSGFTATVAKVNGVAFPASPAVGSAPVVTAANTITYRVPVSQVEVSLCGAV